MPTPEPTNPAPAPMPAPQPNFTSSLITADQRYDVNMYGGWGAHLGHLLRSNSGSMWFVADSGNNVNVNPGLRYFTFTNGAWSQVHYEPLPGLVQQNTGSVMSGSMIYSYGVDWPNNRIVECAFETSSATSLGCVKLPFDTGASANYIGATVSRSGTRVVWWTNTTGRFNYIYNYGGGWNGPVSGSVAGYADFSYVYARLADDNSTITFAGAAAKGLGGSGVGYDALFASTTLSAPVSNWQLLKAGGLGMETWLDPRGGAHILIYGWPSPQYFYRAAGGSLIAGAALPESGVVSARIVESGGDANLVLSLADGTVHYRAVPKSSISGPIDWSQFPLTSVDVPAGLGVLTLYPESAMYQSTQPAGLNFAVNGSSQQGLVYFLKPR